MLFFKAASYLFQIYIVGCMFCFIFHNNRFKLLFLMFMKQTGVSPLVLHLVSCDMTTLHHVCSFGIKSKTLSSYSKCTEN